MSALAALQAPPELPPSVIKILEGALRMVGSRGVRRLSMSDISDASGVSRGTLYRYFSDKDEVLEAVGEFISVGFETGIRAAAASHGDPVARLRAVMAFFANYTVERSLNDIFVVEPGFHLNFFRSHFARHRIAVLDALAVSFDHIERHRGIALDRLATAEMLVRMQLSTLIVPPDANWCERWRTAPERIEHWVITHARPSSVTQESE